MAKNKAVAEVASLNPAEMMAGGLKSDFRGVIREARWATFDYKGTTDPRMAARLTIKVEGDDKPYVDYWSAADLDAFVPSEDGRTPAENEEGGVGEGIYALKVGKKAQMSNNSNFAILMGKILDAGAVNKVFTQANLTNSIDCLEGLDAHWDRIPKPQRSGQLPNLKDEEGGEKKNRSNDMLVVSSIYAYGDVKAAKAGASAKAKAKVVVEDDDDDDDDDDDAVSPLDKKLQGIVVAYLESKGGKSKRGKLSAAVLEAAGKDKDKAKLVARVGDEKFLSAGPWKYDEDSGVLELEGDDDEDDDE